MSDVANQAATSADNDGCGLHLKDAREKAGMSLADAASTLKVPMHVVEAIESERWDLLGAPVYARGLIRSYARLLGVDLQPLMAQAHVARIEPVELVSHTHTPRYKLWFEGIARRLVYVAVTAMVAVPTWYWMRSSAPLASTTTASLDAIPAQPLGTVPVADKPIDAASRASGSVPAPHDQAAVPYVASLAVVPKPADVAALLLRFTGDSWFRVLGPEGQVVDQGLLHAGEERAFGPGQAAKVMLGNASAVEVQQRGATLDLAPYRKANVARFTVSSDGSVVPASD